jgi:hypothetical protein
MTAYHSELLHTFQERGWRQRRSRSNCSRMDLPVLRLHSGLGAWSKSEMNRGEI